MTGTIARLDLTYEELNSLISDQQKIFDDIKTRNTISANKKLVVDDSIAEDLSLREKMLVYLRYKRDSVKPYDY